MKQHIWSRKRYDIKFILFDKFGGIILRNMLFIYVCVVYLCCRLKGNVHIQNFSKHLKNLNIIWYGSILHICLTIHKIIPMKYLWKPLALECVSDYFPFLLIWGTGKNKYEFRNILAYYSIQALSCIRLWHNLHGRKKIVQMSANWSILIHRYIWKVLSVCINNSRETGSLLQEVINCSR